MLFNELTRLEQADLIRRANMVPEIEYWFKHGLVQETVYDSLLKHDRKRLHTRVAQSLERAFANPPDELAPILAKHWQEAGEAARALAWYLQAGAAAMRVYANAEASAALDSARMLSAQVELDAATMQTLYEKRGRVLEWRGEYDAAMQNYLEWETRAQARGDASLELQALIQQTRLCATPNPFYNAARAQELGQRALALAQGRGERAAQAQVLWTLLLAEYFVGNMEPAIAYGEQSLAIARALNWREQMAYTLNDLARPYLSVGKREKATELGAEAEQLWRELGNLHMLADNLTNAGLYAFFAADYRAAEALLEQALQTSRATSNTWGEAFAEEIMGMMYFTRGQWEKSLWHLDDAARRGKQIGFVDPEFSGLPFGAFIYRELGAGEQAISLMQKILAMPAASSAWHSAPLAILAILYADQKEFARAEEYWVRAQAAYDGSFDSPTPFLLMMAEIVLHVAQDNAPAAITPAAQMVELVQRTGMQPWFSLALYLQGIVMEKLERLPEARQVLERANEKAQATQTRAAEWEILGALARVEAKLGNAAQANARGEQARAAAQYIADHSPAALRATFWRRVETELG